MDKLLDEKTSPALIGSAQAVGVVTYTILIATVIFSLDNFESEAPEYLFVPVILSLLVLSAGLTGTLVFGLPVYFTFAKNNVKRAIAILVYTFLSLAIAILLALLLITGASTL